MKCAKVIAALSFLLVVSFRLHATDASDLATELQALETADTTPASDVTIGGVYYSAKLVNVAGAAGLLPFPTSMNYPAWNLGDNVWLVDDLPSATPAARSGVRAMDDSSPPDFTDTNSDGGDYTNVSYLSLPPINTNILWLQITNIANGLVYANLNMATDTVYAIWSTTNLLTPLANWQVAAEVWPTNATTNAMPFTVNVVNPDYLFLRAQDWTGITTNGLPDWWLWEYFENFSENATNLDSQGANTLGYDYTNGIDPNIISFTLAYANQNVNAYGASVQLDVTAGTPNYVAILVDDTNQADASWTAYTSTNITVSLGTTEGWHQVSIGLRGLPPNADQTWQYTRLKLDLTPPLLAITNPVTGTVIQPLIQLQGYSPEALSSLSYDLTNASGLVTNQPALILDQYFDTNTLEFTTNDFQCFDVPLTNGVNTITLHATDLAGNVTTTNFSYTLDYSSATNPPVIQLGWPQAGTQISGSSFTWRGSVSEPTAQVVAQTFNADGSTNSFSGQVGRDGSFWISGLPLSSGTNNFSLLATDAAGNMVTTNISVIQSTLVLTITSAALGQPVQGTISDWADYTIWVNGVKATNNLDGTWIAQDPHLTLDTPNVQVRAIPNTDNGGNGGGH
jgi:hypothetical protein